MTNVVKFSLAAVVVAFAFSFAAIASAVSASAIYTPSSGYLMVGSGMGAKAYQASNVVAAQTALNACVPGTSLVLDGKFGPLTKGKFMAFQASVGIAQDGIIGPVTAGQLAACSTDDNGNDDNNGNSGSGLSGGAGSVDSYTLITSLNNEEVGEGAEDVEVAGLEIENSDDSDIEIRAVKLVFAQGTATNDDFEDFASDVSILLDGEEIARVDADSFTEDNSYTKTVSVDSGAVIDSGDTAEITVAISGVNNIDSNDLADTWTVDFTSIRFEDAQGTVTSEDPTVGVRTFSFESFATSSDTELKITSDDEDVNDAHVIDIHATEETSGVEVLSFKMEVEGDSDIDLDDLPVNFDVTGQDNIDEMVSGITLWMDGDEVSSINMGTDGVEDPDGSAVGADETYVFTDMDLSLEAGETYEFLVKVDIYGITDTGDVAAGDTISANLGETQTDAATFDATDEEGEDLADADVTGSASSSASEVRDVSFNVTFVESDSEISHAGDISNATDSDQGTFTITFDVTAFGGNIYIDGTKPDETGGTTESDLAVTGTDTYVDSNIRSSTGATLTGTEDGDARYLVEEDTTERFTITFVTEAGADGLFQVSLGSILYALTDVDGDITYTFGLEDFKTPSLSMQNDAV